MGEGLGGGEVEFEVDGEDGSGGGLGHIGGEGERKGEDSCCWECEYRIMVTVECVLFCSSWFD